MGDSPFFVNACLDNFFQTSGIPAEEIDFHLLTVDPISKEFHKAVTRARYPLSLHVHPFGRKRDKAHMNLLDWAITRLGLSEWVYVTHSDMFWLDDGWLAALWQHRGEARALMMPYSQYRGEFMYTHQKYVLRGVPLTRAHDFAGLYHLPTLNQLGLKFACGFLGTEAVISQKLRSVVEAGELAWLHRGRPVVLGDMMDGSDVIGLELAVHGLGVIEPPLSQRFAHGWDTLGLGDDIQREGDVLNVHRLARQCKRGLPSYAWISSFLVDRDTSQVIFPWAVFRKLAPLAGYSTGKSAFCAALERYADPGNRPIGPDDLFGVKKVVFLDGEYDV